MKREDLVKIKDLCRKEEKERCKRVKKMAQGTEILFYLFVFMGILAGAIMDEEDMIPMFISGYLLSFLFVFSLYYNPLLYEREQGKQEKLLKKYCYIPVDLKQLCIAKIIVFCKKVGKIYLINLVMIGLVGMAIFDTQLIIYKAVVSGLILLAICASFFLNLVWQYKSV